MAQPTTQVFEPREDLGMRYDEFDLQMNQMGFIAHRVMPIVPRSQPTGKFPRVAIGQFLQNLSTERNPDGTYKRSRRVFQDDNYETKEYGLEATLDDRTVARYEDFIDAEQFEGEVIENSLLTDYERKMANHIFNATTWAGRTAAVATPWSTWDTADPNKDINDAVDIVRLACGVKPNSLVINDPTFRQLINCDSVIDRLKFQGFQDARPGEISAIALAISLNIDRIIIADCLYNTVEPSDEAAASLADIWNKDMALVARLAVTNNPGERCVGRTIMWSREGATSGGRMAVIAEQYYENQRRGGVIRRRTDYGLKDMQLECGYLLTNVNP